MFELTDSLKITLLILLGSSYIIYEMKPDLMFHKDGKFKQFGLKKGETVVPFFLGLFIISFVTYYGLLLSGGKYI